MDDKTLQALTALAEKLGTTAEYLWSVLLKQAPISGTVNLIVMIAFAAGAYGWFRVVRRKTTKPAATESDRYPSAEWSDEFGVGMAWGGVALFALLAVVVIAEGLGVTVAAFFNPEYWALKQILK